MEVPPAFEITDSQPLEGASGKPKNWATWWILDGGDDAESLRSADVRANLSGDAVSVIENFRVCFHFSHFLVSILFPLFVNHHELKPLQPLYKEQVFVLGYKAAYT